MVLNILATSKVIAFGGGGAMGEHPDSYAPLVEFLLIMLQCSK